jgi:ABC-type uncharacterized transport system involved in gliding motility auxiliary subunit
MKFFVIRLQLVFVSVILFLTFALMMGIVSRYNFRWDFTKEKLYSLNDPTVNLLRKLSDKALEVMVFYPHDDPAKDRLETFLRQCRLHHPKFNYHYYDPDRVPSLAKKYNVKDAYTLVILYGGAQEKVIAPSEEAFANALLRLAKPLKFNVCFATTHGEPSVGQKDRSGINLFAQSLEANNYGLKETLLGGGESTISQCDVFVIDGPKRDFDASEFDFLNKAFEQGSGILFLIDPMDIGQGKAFVDFFTGFGVTLGENVIVDKMSKLVGGDFLVPLVSQYVVEHPITAKFNQPTFFPVTRSVNPSTVAPENLDVVPLALSGSGSWAETNLATLENGDAAFDPETDTPGPICLAVAVEKKKTSAPQKAAAEAPAKSGRMVVVGDSDFVSNAYFELSGNGNFAVNMVQWLAKDDRFIAVHVREPEFKPLFLTEKQRLYFMVAVLAFLPGFFCVAGFLRVFLRKRAL